MKQKKNLKKRQKTSFEKEQSFIKISTNILVIAVIVIAIVVSFTKTFGDVDMDDGGENSISGITALTQTVDTSTIITHQLSDAGKPDLISKITASGLDILTGTGEDLDYTKYSNDTININSSLSLTAEELGLVYSYLFVDNPDKYSVVLYEISITKENDNYIIKTVASIDFYKLFTSKVSNNYDTQTLNSLPKRVYVTNYTTFSNGEYTFSTVKYNNLNGSESSSISTLINNATPNIDLNKYVPNLIISMTQSLAIKTGTTIEYNDNGITFKKGA